MINFNTLYGGIMHNFNSHLPNKKIMHKDEGPCPPTQRIADEEIDDAQREVEDNIVEPFDTDLAPSNALDRSKCPVGIYNNQSGILQTP
jgi:hypothetical protein